MHTHHIHFFLWRIFTREWYWLFPYSTHTISLLVNFTSSDIKTYKFHYNCLNCNTESSLMTLVILFSSVQLLSLLLFATPMDYSTPGLPVHDQFLEFTQTYVHWVSDAIQPSHPLSTLILLPSTFPIIRVFSNESVLHIWWQSIRVSASASVLPMNIQEWFPLGWTGWISLLSKGLSRDFSNTTVQKHQVFCAQLSL